MNISQNQLSRLDVSKNILIQTLEADNNNLSVVILPDSLKIDGSEDTYLNFIDNPLNLNYKVYFSDTSFSKYCLAQDVTVRNGFNDVFKRCELGSFYDVSDDSNNYDDSNNLATEYTIFEEYKNGSHSSSSFSYENGKLKKLTRNSYLGKDLHESKEEFYQTGEKKSQNFYLHGNKHGKNYSYFENGKIKTETNYKKGKKHGISKEFYPSGILAKKSKYKNDKLRTEKRWLENGELNKN